MEKFKDKISVSLGGMGVWFQSLEYAAYTGKGVKIYSVITSNCTIFSILYPKVFSIGTPKAINFPFVSDEKLKFFRCPSIQAHCNEAVIYLNFGTPKNNEFSIWNKW